MSLQHISTHQTGLVFWGWTRFTLLPETGQVVIWGKTVEADSPALHIYNGSSDSWQKERTETVFCEHLRGMFLPVSVQQQQLLAVSCQKCHMIRLYNIKTREITTAFHNSSYYPACMCQGEADQIYVVHKVKGPVPILQLNCSQPQFTLEKTIQSGMETWYDICYIPSHRQIAISSVHLGVVRAVSCDTEENAWEIQGEIQSAQCLPHRMVYSPGHQALLVADGGNHRVLVVNPGIGSVIQVLQLGADVGVVAELCLHNQQLVVHHTDDGHKMRLSYFSLS